jgi:hypothetical protein
MYRNVLMKENATSSCFTKITLPFAYTPTRSIVHNAALSLLNNDDSSESSAVPPPAPAPAVPPVPPRFPTALFKHHLR